MINRQHKASLALVFNTHTRLVQNKHTLILILYLSNLDNGCPLLR